MHKVIAITTIMATMSPFIKPTGSAGNRNRTNIPTNSTAVHTESLLHEDFIQQAIFIQLQLPLHDYVLPELLQYDTAPDWHKFYLPW